MSRPTGATGGRSTSEVDAMKAQLRRAVAAALSALDAAEVAAQSLRVAARVVALPEFAAATAVSVYLHMPREAQTTRVLEAAFAARKKVYVPKILGRTPDDMKMVHALSAPDVAAFPRDKWQIPDPPLATPDGRPRDDAIDALDLDLVLLPAVAFDRRGARLGHGKAYYDCFLRRLEEFYVDNRRPMPTLIGICLAPQLLGDVPVDEHDYMMDVVVTPDEVLRFRPKQ